MDKLNDKGMFSVPTCCSVKFFKPSTIDRHEKAYRIIKLSNCKKGFTGKLNWHYFRITNECQKQKK